MPPKLFPDELGGYLDGLVSARPAEMARMESRARADGFPIIGPACGQCCYVLTRLIRARHVFELGSGFGYSTAWFARGVQENGGGEVHHVVWDADLSARARTHLATLGYGDIIRYHVGEAVGVLEQSEGPFDIIFLDIEKTGYPAAVPVIAARLRPGGILIADNMLWHGSVLDPADTSPHTAAIRKATRLLTTSPDWLTTMVPIRDGLVVAMRA